MDTKERNREKKAPAGQRKPTRSAAPTAKPPQQPKAKRPPAQAEGDYEVYVPDAESQQVRHSSENDGAGTRRAPAQRRAAPAKSSSKAPARNKETQYRPYRQANQRKKAQKKKSFRESASRFFSYQNPIVRKFYKEDPAVFGEDASAARREKRAAEAEKKRKRAQQLKTPAVIYTQPVTFNSRRLAIQLTTILAVVLALVLGMSVFFKVEVISVVGADVYSEWTIREQSGINEGDNLLTFGRTKASGQIIANLPYVKSARIGIKLPDTVIIEIEEEAVVYSIQDQDGVWWLINSDGKVVEQTNAQNAKTHTQVLGVTLYQPQPSELGIATEEAPTETDASGEVMPVLVTGAQRLNAALKILQALELNDIVGDAASVDVSQLQDIILWYGTQYQVNLGSINNSKYDIAYKITYMKNAILQMSDYQTGILDVSFTTWPDQIGYTPFG
ncbi:MAG: FtsQ-type POTRA domain-containing protein [Candidatus Faecousia sp.]|nr:FtsQ-type POTRA domain-containing protein [Candidatus Faecousia sp.]